MNKSSERPVLIQGSEAPIFVNDIETGEDLICEGCKKSVLVKNHIPECLIGIGLECFKCGYVTWTPSMPAGEVFPKKVITIGDSGKFLIGSSVNNKGVVITCNQELASVAKRTAPRTVDFEKLEFSIEYLEKLSVELDLLSGGKFNKFLRSAKKAVDRGHQYYRLNPLAWAIEFIKNQLNNNILYKNDDTLVALAMIQGYKNIIHRWKNHHHIAYIAQEFCSSFYHTLIQFIAATYLSDHGNKIAVNPPNPYLRGRVADLYVRVSACEKLFMEVKAPKAVEWPNKIISRKEMKKVVETCLSNARGQISTKNPGVLIIGTTSLSSNFLNDFEEIIRKVLSSNGRNYSGVAGIGYVGLNKLALYKNEQFSLNFSASYFISVVKNLYYFQDNPIQIDVELMQRNQASSATQEIAS